MRSVINWRKRGLDLAVLAGIGTFLSIVSPYGATSAMPVWGSWLYWVGLIIYGALIGEFFAWSTARFLSGWPDWIHWLIVSLSTALMVTPVIAIVHSLFSSAILLRFLPTLYLMVWVISAAVTGIGYLRSHGQKQAERVGEGDVGKLALRSFSDRLPVPFRTAELYALSSEDHYLRVYTSAGEHMLLERLGHAVQALQEAPGLQTHRSWWVAENAIERAQSQSGKITLTLKNGVQVPVSRSFQKRVREAGWI